MYGKEAKQIKLIQTAAHAIPSKEKMAEKFTAKNYNYFKNTGNISSKMSSL